MESLESPSTLRMRALEGKRIERVICGGQGCMIVLEGGDCIDISVKGAPAGYEWADYLVVCVNGVEAYRS